VRLPSLTLISIVSVRRLGTEQMRSVHFVRTYYAPPMAPYDRVIRVNSDPAQSASDRRPIVVFQEALRPQPRPDQPRA